MRGALGLRGYLLFSINEGGGEGDDEGRLRIRDPRPGPEERMARGEPLRDFDRECANRILATVRADPAATTGDPQLFAVEYCDPFVLEAELQKMASFQRHALALAGAVCCLQGDRPALREILGRRA